MGGNKFHELIIEKYKCVDAFSVGHFIFGQTLCCHLVIIAQYLFSYFIGLLFCIIYSIVAVVGWEILEHTLVQKYIYSDPFYESFSNVLMDIIIGLSSFYLLFSMIYIIFYDLFLSFVSLYFCFLLIIVFSYLLKIRKRGK